MASLCLVGVVAWAGWAEPARGDPGPTTRPAPVKTETQPVGRPDPHAVEHKPVGAAGGSGQAWLTTVAAMAVVVVAIFLTRWLVRRLGGAPGTAPDGVEVLGRTMLSPRHQLHVVRLGRRVVLVGTGPQGLATLSEITDSEEVAELVARSVSRKSRRPHGKGGSE